MYCKCTLRDHSHRLFFFYLEEDAGSGTGQKSLGMCFLKFEFFFFNLSAIMQEVLKKAQDTSTTVKHIRLAHLQYIKNNGKVVQWNGKTMLLEPALWVFTDFVSKQRLKMQFLHGSEFFHKATSQSVPKCVFASHM